MVHNIMVSMLGSIVIFFGTNYRSVCDLWLVSLCRIGDGQFGPYTNHITAELTQ